MEESQPIAKKQNQTTSAPRGGAPKKNSPATFEQKLRAVKLHLEEGFTQESIAQELGYSSAAVFKWTRRYRLEGEDGLRGERPGPRHAKKLPEPVRQKILELKKEEPTRGIKRISQLLRRVFFLQASSETVRHTQAGRAVRTGEIGNKQTGVMGYTSRPDALDKYNPDGRDNSICDAGADGAFYGDRAV
jgi:transposase-like protein